MDDASAFAEEIEDAAAAIRSAIDGLEVKPEAGQTALKTLLDKAAKLKKSDYTAASWKTLTNAVEKGRQVLMIRKLLIKTLLMQQLLSRKLWTISKKSPRQILHP